MTGHRRTAPGAGLGFLDRPLPAGVDRRIHTLAAGGRLDCPAATWADALADVETGCIQLVAPAGASLHLCAGALFSLRGLTPAVILNPGPGSAVLSVLRARPTQKGLSMTNEDLRDDPAEFHREIAAGFTARVEGVVDPGWDAPAPVAGWTARDVVGHLVGWFPGFLSSGAGVDLPAGPDVAVDPVAAWRVHRDGVQAVLDDPASTGRMFRNPHTGELPLGDAVSRFYTVDVFMHTWDLARATGQDETLDPDLCAAMLEGMEPIEDLLRSSGQYGPRVPVPGDADVVTRLVAFIGRDPYARTPPPA